MPPRKKTHTPHAGWAMYLRTSSEEAQNPENSQKRQRHTIEQSLFSRHDLPLVKEYIDNLSGRYADNRPGYQQMLRDARAGKFSFVAVENAERFGRNDTEALSAIDELHQHGVSVRFADYPDLDPIDPDDRIVVSLSFTLARRESIKLGQRVKGGLHAKLRSGGFVGKAPDGYINCEEKADLIDKSKAGRYLRWIEQDPEQAKVWRLAWDLLLADQLTLAEICEELHSRGYLFKSGRPFVQVKANGKRKAAANGISRIFRNWFYAGWVVSKSANIPPKTVSGRWKPIVSTEEFERGLDILNKRQKKRAAGRRTDRYFLRGLVYVELPNGKCKRLTGSTSNASRPGGGTSYYCVSSSNINIQCDKVDEQIAPQLHYVQVDPELIPMIREAYNEEIAEALGRSRPDEKADIQRRLKDIDNEEARSLRLFVTGKITERIWNNLWADWQDRRTTLRKALEAIEVQNEEHITNLDYALSIISKIGVSYKHLERSKQQELLRNLVERVVVSPDGTLLRLELLPPFKYLNEMKNHIQKDSRQGGSEVNKKTSTQAGQCSSFFSLSDPYGLWGLIITLTENGCKIHTFRSISAA